jgi:hypothetical protein
MTKQWSQHSRQKQREHIMKHQPWDNSTGPKSDSGKQRSSRNASKGKEPIRMMHKILRSVHKERLELLRWLEKEFGIKLIN